MTTATTATAATAGEAHELFEQLVSASTLKGVVTTHRRLCQLLGECN